jgi:glycosyltransferase involved in cell wall biosynthesis
LYSEVVTIGVDATCWANRRGYGRHARSLLRAAAALDRRNRYRFFVDTEPRQGDFPAGAEVVRVRASAPAARAARSDGRRSAADLWSMSRALAAPDLDCLLFPTVYSYVPVFSRAYKIVMIHDVIPEKYPQYVFPTAAGRWNWRLKSLAARRQADLIVTVSEFSRRALLEYFGERPERVKVVGEAGDPVFRVLEGVEPEPGLLVYVGGFSPHKNLAGLLEAFARLVGRGEQVRLALVGDYQTDPFHTCYRELAERAGQAPLAGRVEFMGYLPDEELVKLLNRATALVLPSLLEGFGLPAIEAAACGLPVIATTASPLPELLGEAGLFVEPGDTGGLEEAMARVLSDAGLRRRLREAGLRAAERLTWERAARDLVALFERVPAHAQAA